MEDILRKLVAFRTVTGDAKAMHQLLEYVADFVTQRGMHVSWFESNSFESLVATVKPGHKTPKVMLAAHADVVPADEAMFELRKLDERYMGRGVLDMKFSIATYLQIIDDLRDNLENYDIGLMITADEELGGRNGVAVLVDEGYLPQVCILPDGGDNWQIQTGSKGILLYEIGVVGLAAHGSRPWLGDNAIVKSLEILDKIALLFPKQTSAETSTLSLTTINSGKAANQIPNAATMTLDIRALNADEYRRLNHGVFEVCRLNEATCTLTGDGAPTHFDLDDPLIAPFARHITAVTGRAVNGSFAMGASDARYFVPFGIPVISVYPEGGDLHADNEWISVQGFEQFKDILRLYLDEIALTQPLT